MGTDLLQHVAAFFKHEVLIFVVKMNENRNSLAADRKKNHVCNDITFINITYHELLLI